MTSHVILLPKEGLVIRRRVSKKRGFKPTESAASVAVARLGPSPGSRRRSSGSRSSSPAVLPALPGLPQRAPSSSSLMSVASRSSTGSYFEGGAFWGAPARVLL